MLRITVIGTSCSGKTTLARRIATANRLPHIELDAINWQPNWTPLPLDEFRRVVKSVVAKDGWVIDGNYSKARDIIWSRATDLVWPNLPFLKVFRRAIRRTTRRVVTSEELFAGNRETVGKALFDRDSIVWWVIRTHRRRRLTYSELFRDREQLPFTVHEIRNRTDEEMVLNKFAQANLPSLVFKNYKLL